MTPDVIVDKIFVLIKAHPKVAEKLNVMTPSETQRQSLKKMMGILEKYDMAQFSLSGEKSTITDHRFLCFLAPIIEHNPQTTRPETELESIFETMAKVLNILEKDDSKRDAIFDAEKHTIQMDISLLCALVTQHAQGASALSLDKPFDCDTYRRLHQSASSSNALSAKEWLHWQYYLLWVLDLVNSPIDGPENTAFSDDTSDLFAAIENNNTHSVQQYIDQHGHNGEKMNLTGKRLTTALHLAIRRNKSDIVKLLMKAEAINVDMQTDTQDTALHIAVRLYQVAHIKSILNKNPTLDLTNDTGLTVLGLALRNEFIDIVNLLLTRGATFSRGDAGYVRVLYTGTNKLSSYTTMLHLAAKHGLSAAIPLLLGKGARLNELDDQGRTPYDLAMASRHTETAKLLIPTRVADAAPEEKGPKRLKPSGH